MVSCVRKITIFFSHALDINLSLMSKFADRRPQTADRRPQTADRRPQTADRLTMTMPAKLLRAFGVSFSENKTSENLHAQIIHIFPQRIAVKAHSPPLRTFFIQNQIIINAHQLLFGKEILLKETFL